MSLISFFPCCQLKLTILRVYSWAIATCELQRLWQFYIGLPVMPRTWKFERPSLDEL